MAVTGAQVDRDAGAAVVIDGDIALVVAAIQGVGPAPPSSLSLASPP